LMPVETVAPQHAPVVVRSCATTASAACISVAQCTRFIVLGAMQMGGWRGEGRW
jgi:hypothetical protein